MSGDEGWDLVQQLTDRVGNLQNTLHWIHHLAAVHYIGGAFDPEHMRVIANMAAEALDPDGKKLPDHIEAMKQAREEAERLSAKFRHWVDGDEDDPYDKEEDS